MENDPFNPELTDVSTLLTRYNTVAAQLNALSDEQREIADKLLERRQHLLTAILMVDDTLRKIIAPRQNTKIARILALMEPGKTYRLSEFANSIGESLPWLSAVLGTLTKRGFIEKTARGEYQRLSSPPPLDLQTPKPRKQSKRGTMSARILKIFRNNPQTVFTPAQIRKAIRLPRYKNFGISFQLLEANDQITRLSHGRYVYNTPQQTATKEQNADLT
jgi:hypothetical protein